MLAVFVQESHIYPYVLVETHIQGTISQTVGELKMEVTFLYSNFYSNVQTGHKFLEYRDMRVIVTWSGYHFVN